MPAAKPTKPIKTWSRMSALHEVRVREAVAAHGLRIKGWESFLCHLVMAHGDTTEEELSEGVRAVEAIRPDAHRIDVDERTIEAWEIVYKSPPRMAAYFDLFWLLDDLGWRLELVYVDARTGLSQRVNLLATDIETASGHIPEGMLLPA